ncbi:MAG: hypothetical protein ACJ8F7_15270 [Gemmataceae bacterium]
MPESIQIEDIEEMRRREGIDDVQLRDGVRNLKAGSFVRLTFLPEGKPSGETLAVRIMRIARGRYYGQLAQRAVSAGLAELRPGVPVSFTAAHIHSLGRALSPSRR